MLGVTGFDINVSSYWVTVAGKLFAAAIVVSLVHWIGLLTPKNFLSVGSALASKCLG